MSEADLREGLRAAVGDEPPLNFDPDELIRRAQHERKRRRAFVAVAVVTLALTGTVLSLPGALDRRAVVDAAGGPVLTTTASPAPTSRPEAASLPATAPPPPSATRSTTGGVASFVSGYLTSRFPEVVPGSKVTAVEVSEVSAEQPAHISAVVRFVDGVGESGLVVRVTAPSARPPFDRFCDEFECDDPQRWNDGTRLVSGTTADQTSVVVSRAVAHLRADGAVVQVTAYRYDLGAGSKLPEVALTVDQLVRLATDPNLAVP
ncbi:hypothetical protein LZG04_12930 [Saccharothrix sp. S26]|uniref:hypothetical protein n=1 Tax=Saccharothrix sp. S26 TaxID=2907215 RepID=UPI001F19C6B9|nr:hypothetical protein [Saccharothrix sp. S26]MCE6995699.1 hypothetical protein [Saccharothrix sp. S26]